MFAATAAAAFACLAVFDHAPYYNCDNPKKNAAYDYSCHIFTPY